MSTTKSPVQEQINEIVDTANRQKNFVTMNPGEKSAHSRFDDLKLSTLDKQIGVLEQLLRRMKALRQLMVQFGYEKVRIDGATKFKRGAKEILQFTKRVEDGIEKWSKGSSTM